jgi:hypothetical protein
MRVPWRRLARRLGKWLLKKAADEALKEVQKRKETAA